MDAFDRERARPHGLLGVGALESMPLDPNFGLAGIETLGAEVLGVALEVSRPTLADGSKPREVSLAIPHVPKLERIERARSRVAFEFDGATLRAQIAFDASTSLYGAGLAAGPLAKKGRAQVFWNSDAWRYGEESPSLYSSHPMALALERDGSATIVVADSIRKGSIAFAQDGLEFAFESEPFDVFVLKGELVRVLAAYTSLLGRIASPPVWSLGYHQCRWSYSSQREVLELAREFRSRRIPCDAIWLDIDHMDRLRAFTWNRATFPDPKAMLDELHASGFRAVAIVDPGLSVDPTYEPTKRALEDGHLVLDPTGKKPAVGRVWPGSCHFPDFSRGATRRFWGELAAEFAELGLDGLWCDMNEPSVFRTPTKTLDESARHRGAGGGTHREFHNLYGHWMARATREGLERARPNERAFVLTRAGHLATARFAAAWTGDNQASWKDLAWSIPMVLSLGLAGQPFSGPDLGGFDGDPSAELFVRWFELGAHLPFARGHSEKSARRKEPWAFGPDVEALVRSALERRMRLVPTFVALFRDARELGLPIARPMFFADPTDARLRELDDQFLLGDSLVVAPVVTLGARSRRAVLPHGAWYRFADGEHAIESGAIDVEAPLGSTPVFAKSGSIVVLAANEHGAKPVTAVEALAADRELHLFLNRDGEAHGELYEDDGASQRAGRASSISARWRGGELELDVEHRGSFAPPARRWTAVLHGGEPARRIDVASHFEAKRASR